MQKLSEWLAYIDPLNPKKIDLSLDRIQQVAEKMQLTQFDQPVVVVGGTNGKGSTVAFLTSILESAGYSVGATYSPHLIKLNERIYSQGAMINDDQLLTCFEAIESERGSIKLTYFEYLILAALYWFKQTQPDVILLEVGLGGRLDAVNVVENDIAVITTISLDHTAILGSTRALIGYEKAGIFKPGKVAVVGDRDIPESIFLQANKVGADLYALNQAYHYQVFSGRWSWSSAQQAYEGLPLPGLPVQNAATALMVTELLGPLLARPISITAIKQGVGRASVPGRWQPHARYDRVWLDVAHNPASATYLAEKLSDLKGKSGIRKIFAVFGQLNTKDLSATIEPMLPWVDVWYVATLSDENAVDEKKIGQCLQAMGCTQYHGYDHVDSALRAALQEQENDVAIVVFGSFYAISDIGVD